jgi:histidine ammonia-lyase
MGTIAARDALRVLELTEQVIAAMLIAARQAVPLRERIQPDVPIGDEMRGWIADLSDRVALVEVDRALDKDLQKLLVDIRAQAWSLYVD